MGTWAGGGSLTFDGGGEVALPHMWPHRIIYSGEKGSILTERSPVRTERGCPKKAGSVSV